MNQNFRTKGCNKALVMGAMAGVPLTPATSHAQPGRVEFSDAGDFSESAVLHGVVLGNPNDKNVFWASQTVMADALQKAQIQVQVLQGEGTGPDAHGLSNSSRIVAGWCAKDVGTEEMVVRVGKGLKG
jgi:hypothetical protein